MLRFNTKINGESWEIIVFSKADKKDVSEYMGENDAAITAPTEKFIVFKQEELHEDVIRHELTHAYFSYLCLHDVRIMRVHDLEEIVCNFIALYNKKIEEKTEELTTKIKRSLNKSKRA